MVVDDIPANVKLLEAQLRMQGYRVAVVTAGPSALAAAKEEPPDLILLDINMPGMDGFEVCRRLKADAALAEIPVLFVTARGQTRDKIEAFAAGAVDYITKPIQVEEVSARVGAHLTIRRQERLLRETISSLRQLEALRDRLVHMVVHDLRSPLTVVQASFELIRAKHESVDTSQIAERGTNATRRMARLVNAMLDMNALETGCLEPTVTVVDLGDLVRPVVDEIATAAGERSVWFVESESPVIVECDGELVSRVLQNMLTNAVEHTHARTGSVSVHLTQGEQGVRVEVRDNGPGVAEEDREVIFEKFGRRVDHVDSHGLGLAFSKLAVEAHGGQIGVRRASGGGSVFWFTLPKREGSGG
jgi:two-component system, sensor histidine kinase and response regulator